MKVNVTDKSGPIYANQSIFLRQYYIHGSYRGYPVYYARAYNMYDCFLYYRKEGEGTVQPFLKLIYERILET